MWWPIECEHVQQSCTHCICSSNQDRRRESDIEREEKTSTTMSTTRTRTTCWTTTTNHWNTVLILNWMRTNADVNRLNLLIDKIVCGTFYFLFCILLQPPVLPILLNLLRKWRTHTHTQPFAFESLRRSNRFSNQFHANVMWCVLCALSLLPLIYIHDRTRLWYLYYIFSLDPRKIQRNKSRFRLSSKFRERENIDIDVYSSIVARRNTKIMIKSRTEIAIFHVVLCE